MYNYLMKTMGCELRGQPTPSSPRAEVEVKTFWQQTLFSQLTPVHQSSLKLGRTSWEAREGWDERQIFPGMCAEHVVFCLWKFLQWRLTCSAHSIRWQIPQTVRLTCFLFITPCECDGLATSPTPLCPPSAHSRITLSSGTLVTLSTGVRGFKQMDASTDKGTSSIVIPMFLASKRNEMRVVKPLGRNTQWWDRSMMGWHQRVITHIREMHCRWVRYTGYIGAHKSSREVFGHWTQEVCWD